MHRNIYCSAWCIVDAQYTFVAEYGSTVGYLSWIGLTSSKPLALVQSPGPKFQLLLDILASISQWCTNSPCPTGSSAASTQVSFLLQPSAPVKVTSSSQSQRPEAWSHSWFILSLLPNPQTGAGLQGLSIFPWKHLSHLPFLSIHTATVTTTGPVWHPGFPVGPHDWNSLLIGYPPPASAPFHPAAPLTFNEHCFYQVALLLKHG